MDLVDMGVGAPVFKKFKKMPLKSFGNFLNNFLHVHISFWYLLVPILKWKYDHMWLTQKLGIWNLYFFEQYTSNNYSVICTFCHFYVGHIQSYFSLRIGTSKYQDNMYMQKFISIIFKILNGISTSYFRRGNTTEEKRWNTGIHTIY
jgi:hypothetical protein